MNKVLTVDLDYELTGEQLELKDDEGKVTGAITYKEITADLIVSAYVMAHREKGMNGPQTREYRAMYQLLNDKDLPDQIILSETDFSLYYETVQSCKTWPTHPRNLAFTAPVLLDELSRVKNRTKEEEKEILDSITPKEKDKKEK